MNDQHHPDDEFLTRYLLGEDLPSADVDRAEATYFKDDRYFERLLEVEDDLIDAYLRGKLSPTQNVEFEHHFLKVARRREKLEAQRAIAEFFRNAARPAPFLTALRQLLQMQPNMVRLATAAVGLVVLVGFGLLAVGYFRMKNESSLLRSEIAAIERGQPASPIIATFVLEPGALRSAGGNRLHLGPGSEWIVLRLRLLTTSGDSAVYSAAIISADSEELWRQTRLPRVGDVVEIRIPATLLSRGDYVVSLAGNLGRSRVELPSYVLHVEN